MTVAAEGVTQNYEASFEQEDAALDLIASDHVLSRLLAYWCSKSGPDRLPSRRDIDPSEIPDLLPHLLMIEVGESGSFRCRLSGSAVAAGYGRELAGKSFVEAFAADAAARAALNCRRVAALGRPLIVHNTYAEAKGKGLAASCLLLPLADSKGVVGRILAGMRAHSRAQSPAPFDRPLIASRRYVARLHADA